MSRSPTLICFAMKEEAKFMRHSPHRILVTGMGQKNAAESLQNELAKTRPGVVLTCGYAGALNPRLQIGDVVFDEDAECGLGGKLRELGAIAARFHCAARIAVTAEEKKLIWQQTGADAVEMESQVMREICKKNKIPSATVRVISDVADEDLPLDFNALTTADLQLDFKKLLLKIALNPQTIPRLMRFQKQTATAGRKLAETLEQLLADR